MNYAPRDFGTDPPDADRRKTVLFCQTCGRAAHIDDWPARLDEGRVARIDCPDCGATVWGGLPADEDSTSPVTPTP